MDGSSEKLQMFLFRAPAAARGITALDRSLFSRVVPSAAAALKDNRQVGVYRKALDQTHEMLSYPRLSSIVVHPDAELAKKGTKCLVLKPDVKSDAPETWSSVLQQANKEGDLTVFPYDIEIDYSLWSYMDVMRSIVPEDLHGDIPKGFNTAGHVAHLNLNEPYLPYKKVIGEVILDKNPGLKTVINKIENVGAVNEFRTFAYEVVAGEDDLMVLVHHANCTFAFDYSKVYWNSKLSGEHDRISNLFQPGEVVVDVMAGIGPFAVPSGKKGVFVFANDKNPESFKYLQEAIKRNKVDSFVRSFNADGHEFIRDSAKFVLEASQRGDHGLIMPPKQPRHIKTPPPPPTKVPLPPTISHFVMNLPASAIEFLHNFKGIYEGHEQLFTPHTQTELPIVHVHCFALKTDDESVPLQDICERIRKEIGVLLTPGDGKNAGEVGIVEVRDVAPAKRMFCASFRLPPSVAFASGS